MLAGIESRAENWEPAQPAILVVFRRIVAAAFATEGESTGAPWAPLAASTQAERRRQHFGAAHPILERTGTLKRSLTTDQGLGFVIRTPTSLTVGSNAKSFPFHQSRRPRTQLPRRAPVRLVEADKQALLHPIRLYITGEADHL